MLNGTSCFAEVCHYIGDYVRNDYLGSIYFKENVTSLDGVSRHHLFRLEIGNHLKEDVQKDRERVQVYDMIWLFGKRCLANIFVHAFSLRSSIEKVLGRQWLGIAPLRHNLLLQKGSYFSQSVNGFT